MGSHRLTRGVNVKPCRLKSRGVALTHAHMSEEPLIPPRLIKRYANRKLYDTERSAYVTLEEIADMVKAGDDIQIVDNRSGEDLTGVTLTQIIYEDQKKPDSSTGLPLSALRSIIQQGGEMFAKIKGASQRGRRDGFHR